MYLTNLIHFLRSGFLFFLIFSFGCESTQKEEIKSIHGAFISAHRGGPDKGYPENALETLQRMERLIPGVMVEIDIRMTKDKKLVLLHDKELSRTTTGSGKLWDYTYDELKELSLKDWTGQQVDFKIPLFREILTWAKDANVFLSLDVKGKQTFKPVIDMVVGMGMIDRVEIITYTTDAAIMVHEINEDVNLSVTIRNEKELSAMLQTGIPSSQLSAFTGLSLKDRTFYESLHREGIMVTLGVLGNLDKKAKAQGDKLYREWKSLGIDRFATDRPEVVYETLVH